MNPKELLNNKPFLYALIGGAIIVLLLFVILIAVVATKGSSGGKDAPKIEKEKIIKEPLDLLLTEDLGKAIEIQALLAREGINAQRRADGSKSTIFLAEYTMSQRDRALLAIVKSGLMDTNVGLEVFDKGDFTSTKEDKRIRLARAINGELSRLIRKIPPIENASVFVSIPEQTMFASLAKPITATVQVTLPNGDKLDKSKVRAITNLLLGSITGLTKENISITDTNGNVYSTIESSDDSRLSKIEENDRYMQSKVQAQLDRLIGKGKYVVTVSTSMIEAPIEKQSIIYDPKSKTSISEQSFSEGLGDESKDSSSGINAVSLYLPNGLPSSDSNASQNRSYSRVARETQYGVSKTQVNEYVKPGVIEEISIAVTVEENAIPPTISIEELKQLVADAASPKVKVENVSIAFTDPSEPFLATEKTTALPMPDESGNPWWIAIAILIGGMVFGHTFLTGLVTNANQKSEAELRKLQKQALEQEKKLKNFNNQALELTKRQEEIAQEAQKAAQLAAQQAVQQIPGSASLPQGNDIDSLTLELQEADDEQLVETIKSWIEKS